MSPSTACLLASYTVQCNCLLVIISAMIFLNRVIYKKYVNYTLNISAELGDYHPDEHKIGYLSGMVLIPGQTEQLENQISELHKLHK